MPEHFSNRAPCLIGIEACGEAHHWARELTGVGHSVRRIHAKAVRPFVAGNKTDTTDARAIWLAVQQPDTKFVGMKTLEQQATLTLHRQRELLMKVKVMQINALRGLLYKFGATFARGRNALFSETPWNRWRATCRSTWPTACASRRCESSNWLRTSRPSKCGWRSACAATRTRSASRRSPAGGC